MRNLLKYKTSSHPLFVKNITPGAEQKREGGDMLYVKFKKLVTVLLLGFVFSSVLFTTNAHAQLFGNLLDTGGQIFTGMREIVFAVSGFGIVAVAVGAFFGNLNWKWLSAIMIGLVVISTTAAIINYMTDGQHEKNGPGKFESITDTLIYAADDGKLPELEKTNLSESKKSLMMGRARRAGGAAENIKPITLETKTSVDVSKVKITNPLSK